MERRRVIERRKKAKRLVLLTPEGRFEGTPFLVSHRGKAAVVSRETIRSGIHMWLRKAKLDKEWNAHDIRGAVASKLFNLGVGEQRVLDLEFTSYVL